MGKQHIELRAHTNMGMFMASPRLSAKNNSTTMTQKLQATSLASQIQYSALVSIGSPSQIFQLVLDTGSSDLWVQGTSCHACSTKSRQRFNATASTSFHNECIQHHCLFEIVYGSGRIVGTVGHDVVTIGDFRIPRNVQVGITTNEMGDISQVLESSGILGLGLPNLATFTTPSISHFMDSFALQLRDKEGTLTINGILNEFEGRNTTWATVPVERYRGNYDYWTVGLPRLTFGHVDICGGSELRCQAVFDSGTGFIAVPHQHWLQVRTKDGFSDIKKLNQNMRRSRTFFEKRVVH